jgi:hypothetical protein
MPRFTNADHESPSDEAGAPLLPELPADEHEEELLDEALVETFPASDPIAVPTPEDISRDRRR